MIRQTSFGSFISLSPNGQMELVPTFRLMRSALPLLKRHHIQKENLGV